MEPRPLRRVGLLLHPQRDCSAVVAAVSGWAAVQGLSLVGREREAEQLPDGVTAVSEHALATGCDLVIAVGGDGTVLRGLRLCAPHETPVLGVNLGRLGFLAEVDRDDIAAALTSIGLGDYSVEDRLALATRAVVDGADTDYASAYNDVVLTRVPGRGQAVLGLFVDGRLFARYSADGLVVATPTGSTAYNFSVNGPLVSPRVQSFMVTAIAPHSAFNRTLVVHRSEALRIDLLRQSSPVVLEIDGRHSAQLQAGDSIALGASDKPGLVVRLRNSNFYERARAKLGLVDPLAIVG